MDNFFFCRILPRIGAHHSHCLDVVLDKKKAARNSPYSPRYFNHKNQSPNARIYLNPSPAPNWNRRHVRLQVVHSSVTVNTRQL
jgi:hypothetical protein